MLTNLLSLLDVIPDVAGRLFKGRVLIGTEVCKRLLEVLPQYCPVHLTLTFTVLHSDDLWAKYQESCTNYLIKFRHMTTSIKVVDDDYQMKFLSLLSCIGAVYDLDVRQNQIASEGMKRLVRAIPNLSELQCVYLGDNRLQIEGMRILNAAVGSSTQWTALSLERNEIGGINMEGVRILVELLVRTVRLSTLNLSDNKLGIEGARILATVLPHLTQMSNLDLSDNWIRPEGMRLIGPALARVTSLQNLNLANNRLGAEGLRALTEPGLLVQLLELNLEFNQLGDGIRALSSALLAAGGEVPLRRLNLLGNQLRAPGALLLSSCLQGLTHLEELNFADNLIGPDGARALVPGLSALPHLQTLNAGDNRLGPDGAREVAASMAGAARLRWVGLECNQVDAEGVRALADAVRSWRALAGPGGACGPAVHVDLGGNGLDSELMAPLAAVAPGRIRAVC